MKQFDPTIKEASDAGAIAAAECLAVHWRDRGLPVDPIEIARKLGVKVLLADMPPDVSGLIYKKPSSDPIIMAAATDSRQRQRFTIAHELGHYVKRVDDKVFEFVDLRSELSTLGTNAEEVFANSFAANLLMPEDRFRDEWSSTSNAMALAARFSVSLEAVNHRIKKLRLV